MLGISCQHALDRHADCFHRLHRRPARAAEEIETDDAIRVDVRVERYGSVAGVDGLSKDGGSFVRGEVYGLVGGVWGGLLGARGDFDEGHFWDVC